MVMDAQMQLYATAYPCGVGNHRSAVVNDKTPLAVVQADQPLSSYRPGHLTRSRRLMADGLGPFPGMLHSPSGFPFG